MPPNLSRNDDDPDIPRGADLEASLISHNTHSTHTPSHPCRRAAAKALGYGLTYTGAASDMAQKAYGASPTLQINSIATALSNAKGWDYTSRLTYLLLAAASAGIQSYCLEIEFTRKLARKILQLPVSEKPVAHGLKSAKLIDNDALFKADIHLNLVEKSLLRVITTFGASTRFITTTMSCGLIAPQMLDLQKGFAGTAIVAGTDFSQAIATDGEFLQKLYLINRLWRRSNLFPQEYSTDYVDAMSDYLHNGDEDDELHHCRTWDGYCVSLVVANIFGALAVGSDVGIAKYALDDFAQWRKIDEQSNQVQNLWFAFQYLSLGSLFLLMYSMDARSLANEVTSWYEDYFHPEALKQSNLDNLATSFEAGNNESSHSSSSDSTPESSIDLSNWGHNSRLIIAGLVCLLGASLNAINGYSGNQYLFGQINEDGTPIDSPNYGILALSVIIAATKFCQSLAVEGVYTKKGIMKTTFPCAAGGGHTSIGKSYIAVPAMSGDMQEALLGTPPRSGSASPSELV